MIQATLRNKLTPDVTVITVAHRLQTIMDVDKIVSQHLLIFDCPYIQCKFLNQMVLEDGRLVNAIYLL